MNRAKGIRKIKTNLISSFLSTDNLFTSKKERPKLAVTGINNLPKKTACTQIHKSQGQKKVII